MNQKRRIGISAPAAMAALALAAAVAFAQSAPPPPQSAPPTRESVERRLQSVGTLIEGSSGARQIGASGSSEAARQQVRARELLASARTGFAAGDYAGANRLLDEAAKAMMTAVRSAAPEQINDGKQKSDFDARFESARALAEAQKRIAAEKSMGPAAAELTSKIDSLLGLARGLAGSADYVGARLALDQAYYAAKAAIGGMRSGDTLVRSLNFASKEEEYIYEVDRNDTHKMLIKVLVQGRGPAPSVEAMIRQSVTEAERLRGEAEGHAARKDFESGIRSLEESTRSLVRAIRGAGIYIPG